MDKDELKGMAFQTANMVRTAMVNERDLGLLIAIYSFGVLRRFRKLEQGIEAQLGRHWLDSGQAKDFGFAALRSIFDALPPDAVCFGSAANKFVPTEKVAGLSIEEQKAIATAGGPWDAVESGHFRVVNAVVATAQSPIGVVTWTQTFKEGTHDFTDTPTDYFVELEEFSGRQKMFGSYQWPKGFEREITAVTIERKIHDRTDRIRRKTEPQPGDAGHS